MKRPATIAIIDDDPSVRRGVERLLRSAGYLVEGFNSAATFLARDGARAPDCMVLDVSMPGQGGLDLHEVLRAAGHRFPVIFITGHGEAAIEARARRAGAAGFVTKPFDHDQLIGAIERALANRREQRG
ncbi:MAG TPA: response regulator [Myxococcales bacterium]|nr:response regulator [Myxococcales bacterium]